MIDWCVKWWDNIMITFQSNEIVTSWRRMTLRLSRADWWSSWWVEWWGTMFLHSTSFGMIDSISTRIPSPYASPSRISTSPCQYNGRYLKKTSGKTFSKHLKEVHDISAWIVKNEVGGWLSNGISVEVHISTKIKGLEGWGTTPRPFEPMHYRPTHQHWWVGNLGCK